MPSAPACSQIMAAATTLGSGARRAWRTVATWSMLTFSRAISCSKSSRITTEDTEKITKFVESFLTFLCGKSRTRHRRPRKKLLLLYHCSGARCADRFTVFSGVSRATNPAHLINHAQAITRVISRSIQRSARTVIPAHRDFSQPEPRQVCEINQFHIKTEAVDLGGFNQWAADIHPKSLESALRVPKR